MAAPSNGYSDMYSVIVVLTCLWAVGKEPAGARQERQERYLDLRKGDLGLALGELVKQALEGGGPLLNILLHNNEAPHPPLPLHLHICSRQCFVTQPIEIAWTVTPRYILVLIAIPSFASQSYQTQSVPDWQSDELHMCW